jgi:predicted nuclease of predicted toxin-antitoxin system
MLNFLIDTQLPPALARFLIAKGYDAIHTTEYPAGHLLQDSEIIRLAIENHRIIITKDNDFLDNFLLRGSPPDVLLLEVGNIRNADLLMFFEHNMQVIEEAFNSGTHLVILNKNNLIQF